MRVETYRTQEGEEFAIKRRARPGRRCQKPRETGEELSCPFCGSPHPVLYYVMREGEEGERKVRSWECPMTGRMSLNIGSRFQRYIDSIIIRRGDQVRSNGEDTDGEDKARKTSSQGVRRGVKAGNTENRANKYAEARKTLERVIRNVGR